MYEELKNLSLKQLLGYVIFSEQEAAKLYRNLIKDMDKDSLVAHKFESIAKDEDKHMKVLQDLYRETFGDEGWTFPDGLGLKPFETEVKVKTIDNLIHALDAAMQNEYKGYKVYRYLAKVHKDQRKLFMYIANNEHSHYDILKREKEQLEDAMLDEPEKLREQISNMPHMKDYGFKIFG
ncbi:MAG: ferritin family protein [Thermoplasmata archaeon]|nr:ferritin family protein [Thermoplasmata archaeon]